MERLYNLRYRVARLERLSKEKNTRAEDVFFDNPLHKSVKEFADSKALSNDPQTAKHSIEMSDNPDRTEEEAEKETRLAPPPPSEIKANPGGDEFSTLNQLVIDTEEKVKGLTKGFKEAPKVDPLEPLPEASKDMKQIKKEVVKKVMRRKGYVITNFK